jgi:hypothetical protein
MRLMVEIKRHRRGRLKVAWFMVFVFNFFFLRERAEGKNG